MAMLFSDAENPASPESLAARYCSESSIEVKERVMTILCSSAEGTVWHKSQAPSRGAPAVPVIPSVGILYLLRKSSQASSASEVRPEREMTPACNPVARSSDTSGNSITSEAGSAKARWPVWRLQDAAAASAR